MTPPIVYTIRCDHPGCTASYQRIAGTAGLVPASWWAQFVTGDDGLRRLAVFCPEHEPLPGAKGNA